MVSCCIYPFAWFICKNCHFPLSVPIHGKVVTHYMCNYNIMLLCYLPQVRAVTSVGPGNYSDSFTLTITGMFVCFVQHPIVIGMSLSEPNMKLMVY